MGIKQLNDAYIEPLTDLYFLVERNEIENKVAV